MNNNNNNEINIPPPPPVPTRQAPPPPPQADRRATTRRAPIRLPAIPREPDYGLSSNASRRRTQRGIEHVIYEMSWFGKNIIKDRLPTYQSKIQHLLDNPTEDSEEKISALGMYSSA
jgi:hypothetical protein